MPVTPGSRDVIPAMHALRRRIEARFPAASVNFWSHVTEGSLASFGFEIVAANVVFQVIAQRLGATPSLLGALLSVGHLTFLSPLLFARRIEMVRRKKRLVMLLGIGQRLPFLVIPFLLLFLAKDRPLTCLVGITAVNLLAGFAVSLLAAAWTDLLAETIPRARLGRLFGYRNTFSSIIGLLAGPLSALIIAAFAFPGNYALVYGIAFVAVTASWVIFAMVDEVATDGSPRDLPGGLAYYRQLIRQILGDRPFQWFFAYGGLSRLGFVANGFYAFVAKDVHGVSDAFAVAAFVAVPQAAKIVCNLPMARLAERIGHKGVMQIGTGLHALAMVLAATAPSGAWFVGVFALSALGMAAQTVSGAPFSMSVYPTGKRIGYIAVSNSVLAPVGLGASILGGVAMERWGHGVLFAMGAVLVLLAALPLERCRPVPRAA